MLREQNARNMLWKLSQFEIVKVTTAQWLCVVSLSSLSVISSSPRARQGW